MLTRKEAEEKYLNKAEILISAFKRHYTFSEGSRHLVFTAAMVIAAAYETPKNKSTSGDELIKFFNEALEIGRKGFKDYAEKN